MEDRAIRSRDESLTTSVTVVRNSVAMITAQIIVRALMVLFSIYVTRRLGSAEYGRYSLVTSIINFFSLPADLGLSLYCVHQIARDRRRTSYLTTNAAGIRLAAAFPIALIATLMSVGLRYQPSVVVGVLVAGAGFVLLAFQSSLDAMLAGHERLGYSAVLSVTGQLLFIGMGICALQWYNSFLAIVGASFSSVVVTTALGFGLAHLRLGRLHLDLVLSDWKSLIRAALPIALLQSFFSVALRADTFLLKQLQGDVSVGWYNAAYDIIFGLFVVASGINLSVFASISRVSSLCPDVGRSISRTAAKYLLLFYVPCTVGGILLADRIVGLVYGSQFAPSSSLLRLLLCALPIRALVGLADNLTIVYGRTWRAAGIAAGDALLNIALNLLLIPRFGAQAAAAITILCEGIVLLLLLWVLRDQALLSEVRFFGVKSVIASGVMAIVVCLLWRSHELVLVGSGALTYFAVLVLSGVVSISDLWKMAGRVFSSVE